MTPSQSEQVRTAWWGRYAVAPGTGGFWQIGPLKLWIHRTASEWRVASERGDDPLDATLAHRLPIEEEVAADRPGACRFGFRKTGEALHLVPALADRPLVVNPATPFSLPAGEALTLYISSALWVKIRVGDPPVDLLEVPTHRPSDTWFGPSTIEGELCYAGKTSARHQLENLPVRPHRAISAVRIRNLARSNLSVERLKLPLPHMSLFGSESGQLWTESVTLEREQDGELAALRLGSKPPAQIGKASLTGGPREKTSKGLLIRAFGGLIGLE